MVMPVASCVAKSSWAMKPVSGMLTLALSRVSHTKLTGRRREMKSSPAGRGWMSFLSLASEREVMVVTWQRRLEIELFPRVTALLDVADAP